jgi:hypothetical protein
VTTGANRGWTCDREESEDREGDCRRDEGRNPDGYAQAECEVEDVAEPEHEGEADDDPHDHGDRLNDRGFTRT